jgi:TolB-like protein
LRYLFEEYAFDTDRRELHSGSNVVTIAPQVFDLLEYLVRNRERVVSKDDLINAIWNGRSVSDVALTTRLNALRGAIADSGKEQRLIKTLPRKGFRFIGQVLEINQPDDAAAANNLVEPSTDVLAPSDKPSIAVLPFQNMSGDPEQEYFADGLVDDITTALSRFRALFVIARNSSFTYKGKAVDIRQVGRELGVRYVLEGSVRKVGARIRINGQLIDVATGAHLWADRFDGALEDIFDLQDEVAQQVVGAIAPEVDRAEIERASRRSVGNIDAVTAYYRGLHHTEFPTSPENNDAALRDFNDAMALDRSFAPAYGGAASCLAWRRANRWPGDIAQDNAELLRLAECVKELGTDDALTLSVLGFNLFWILLEFNRGFEMVERAIHSNPNYARAYNFRGLLRAWHGASDAAIADFEQAMRLSPRDPFNYNAMMGLAVAHHNAGRHLEAAEWADKSLRAFPPAFFVGATQAILCYVGAGRLEDAQRVMAECLRRVPRWRRSTAVAPQWIRSPELRAELLEAFIRAGLPE